MEEPVLLGHPAGWRRGPERPASTRNRMVTHNHFQHFGAFSMTLHPWGGSHVPQCECLSSRHRHHCHHRLSFTGEGAGPKHLTQVHTGESTSIRSQLWAIYRVQAPTHIPVLPLGAHTAMDSKPQAPGIVLGDLPISFSKAVRAVGSLM